MSEPTHSLQVDPLLDVAEIFASLQGEGPFMGQPAVFVRLAGCLPPLCAWCDTPQALGSGQHMTPDGVAQAVLRYPPELVVITGGEPFRQWDCGLAVLVELLLGAGRRVQYETSGKAGIPAGHRGFVVCSPKPMERPQLSAKSVLQVDMFKFVVKDDMAPILEFVHEHGIDPCKVWLMPFGATRSLQMQQMPAVWEQCQQYGYNFAPRLHILTYDDRKGV